MSAQYSHAAAAPRVKPLSIVVALILGGTALFTLIGLAKAGPQGVSAFTQASFQSRASLGGVVASVWNGLRLSTFSPWYWIFVACLTILQWFWPARRDERSLSVDMAVDAVWFVMGNAMQFTVVAATLGAVTVAYTEVLGTWSLHLERTMGFWGLAAFAFVLTDLLAWVTHWCHHKVPTLWRFHAVHHSQRRLNALSDNRTHVGEVVVAALIVFVPSQLLGLNAPAAMGLAFLGLYYSAMLHSNIRTNFGPLKYIFLGPQFHRVHHSTLPRHFDTNFGTVFSWWDYLAHTMYRVYDEYPPTGIQDGNFPLRERGDLNPWRWLVIFSKQLGYPFQGLVSGPVICRTVRGATGLVHRLVMGVHAKAWEQGKGATRVLRLVGPEAAARPTDDRRLWLVPPDHQPGRRDAPTLGGSACGDGTDESGRLRQRAGRDGGFHRYPRSTGYDRASVPRKVVKVAPRPRGRSAALVCTSTGPPYRCSCRPP